MSSGRWSGKNQEYIVSSLNRIKLLLNRYVSGGQAGPDAPGSDILPWEESAPPAIESLRMLFGLSEFETSLVLLCAGSELDSEVARLCATALGNQSSPHPTLGLALAALPKPHWSALAPASPLRRFSLIEIPVSEPASLTSTPIRLEERVLHYLAGISYLEPQLNALLRRASDRAQMVDSHELLVRRVALSLGNDRMKMPLIQLSGSDESSKVGVARASCSRVGLDLWQLAGELAPSRTDEIDRFVRLWTREAALLTSGLYISAEELEPPAQRTVRHLAEQLPGPVFLGTRERWSCPDPSRVLSLEVKKPERAEQGLLWRASLATVTGNPVEREVSRLVGQFNLSASEIREAIEEARLLSGSGPLIYDSLWDACLALSRPGLSELAHRIVPSATMEELVLPESEKRLLGEIAIHVAQRQKVYEEWGFGGRSDRGLGITALFSGASGTGKTMAAEVLANELKLDLFRIDIATVVSKYIGETEKNLRRVFDAAEDGGAILFFDEADALFGKRSEVRDSHDRYANIETSYLLQRMESYRGLAILSTNMRDALDPAFARRIRFRVDFPFPDQKSRAEIWRRVFPRSTPVDSLDPERLARLNISGGNIRNIALYASFLAADEGTAVKMRHLKRAAQVEYDKLERPLTGAEMGGDWQ